MIIVFKIRVRICFVNIVIFRLKKNSVIKVRCYIIKEWEIYLKEFVGSFEK